MLLLPDTLTVREASLTLRMLKQSMRAQAGQELVIDATPLRHFDSSALAVLLECEREAAAWGRRLEVRNMPPRLSSLAEVYGVAGLIQVSA